MEIGDDKPSVLLTEDEALISLDLCDALQEAGYRVIGPANTVAGALFLLDQERPQVAIVDLLLRDGSCAALVRQLRQRSVPFVIYSGYRQEDHLITMGRDAPWLAKPSSPSDIIARLDTLLRHPVPA